MNIGGKKRVLSSGLSRLLILPLLVALALASLVPPGIQAAATLPAGSASSAGLLATSGHLPAAATSTSSWVFQGPAPALKGQEDLVNVERANEPVSGAIGGGPYSNDFGLIAASPTDPNTIYVGSDGGIWKTTNATAASPSWTPLIDSMPSTNVRALSADPTDATFQTVLAGSDRAGLYYTTNGGTNWTQIFNTLLVPSGYTGGYQAVAARGNILLAANGNGLFRTTGGPTGTWTKISGTGGLPAAAASDLVGDPANPSRLYVTFTGASGGIFRSDNQGSTWTDVNVTSGIDVISSATSYFRIAVFNNGTINVVTVTLNGSRNAVYRSVNSTAFVVLDTPEGDPSFIGADKTNPNLVYVGGYGKPVSRVDASQPSGSQATRIEWEEPENPPASLNYGYPHPDYVAFAFDANGSLLAGTHGGIYRLPAPGSPASATNYWVPIMGNLGAFFFYDNQIAYDHISHVILGQAQDNGDVYQTAQGSQVWTHAIFADGDGAPVSVDNVTLAASGQSIRYQGTTRFVFDANNNEVSRTTFNTSVINDDNGNRTLNTVDPRRILFGGSGYLYESPDMGNTITRIADRGVSSSIAYGGYRNSVANPDVLYFGNGYYIYSRTTAGGPVTQLPLPPAGSGLVKAVVMDPNDWMTVYISDDLGQVYKSTNGGTTWSDITGNLKTGAGSYGSSNSINVIPGAAGYLVVGSGNGVYSTPLASPGTWSRLGINLPNVHVGSTVFDTTDDVLVIGTIGRGAYLLPNASKEFNDAPTLALSGAATANEGSKASYTFTVADPNAGDTFTVDSLTVGAGGELVPGSLVTTPTGGSFRVSYPDGPTSPTISLLVKDSYAAPSNTATANVTVNNTPPTPRILGAPTSGSVGTPINLTASATDPSAGDTTAGFTYYWAVWKDGPTFKTGSGLTFSFTPDTAATYSIGLAVTDKDGDYTWDFKDMTVASLDLTENNFSVTVNEGQPAVNSGTFANVNGNPVTLSASVGTLLDSPSTLIFDSFSPAEAYAGPSVDTIFTTTQPQKITRILNWHQNTSFPSGQDPTTVGGTISIRDYPSGTPRGTWPASALMAGGSPLGWEVFPNIVLPAGSYRIVESQTGSSSWSYTLTGGAAQWAPNKGMSQVSAAPVPASGTWSWSYTPGDGPAQSQDVTITATDTTNGNVSSISFPLVVTNVAPTATLSNGGAVSEGSTGMVSFSNQSDPSTADAVAGFHYAYDFDNDGIFDAGDGSYAGSGTAVSATVPASLLMDGPGTRMVRGRIIDKDSDYTDYTTTITINNAAPTASVSGPASALAGQIVTFVVGGTDASAVDQAAGFTYSITWGDGSPVQTISRSAGNGAAPASHAFAATGSYNVQVTATDKNGTASAAPASKMVAVNALNSSSLQALIATAPIVNLSAPNNTIAQSMVTFVNRQPSPAPPVVITIVLGTGTYTGVTASPKASITLVLAGTDRTVIQGASPALTVTEGEVFAQGLTLTNDTDAPTVLVTGGHATLGEANIQESTGFNNVAVKLTGGTLTLGFDMFMNINGQGSFFQTYDHDAIGFPDGIDADLTPNTYAVNGVHVSATILSATDLESSANPSTFGQVVTFTAGIDVEADEFGEATGTVTFYEGTAVLGSGMVSEVGPDVFEASFTTSSLSVGSHTITAVYGGNAVYLASSAQLTQLVGAFPFAGFFGPVSNPPTLNQVNSGQNIAFIFSLGGNRGLNIIAAGYPVSQQFNCSSGTPIGAAQQATVAMALSYNPTTGRYTYTWKTQKSWAGTCRKFTLRLTDGTDHVALFMFK